MVLLAELLAAEGVVAGDLDDHTYGLLAYFCLFWDAFVLFGHSDGVLVVNGMDVSHGERLACTLRLSRGRSTLYGRNFYSTLHLSDGAFG